MNRMKSLIVLSIVTAATGAYAQEYARIKRPPPSPVEADRMASDTSQRMQNNRRNLPPPMIDIHPNSPRHVEATRAAGAQEHRDPLPRPRGLVAVGSILPLDLCPSS